MMSHNSPTPAAMPHLDDTAPDRFKRQGYLVLPRFLPNDLLARLKPEADTWVDHGLRARSIAAATGAGPHETTPPLELELPTHGELIAHPPLMDLLTQLMGGEFVYHHLHSDRQGPHTPDKPWHHDYEQRPQLDRTHTMIHVLHYLDGLDEDTAALAVLPGSHREVAEKKARAHLGSGVLSGEVVIDRLPPGSTVVLHSALFHTRRRNLEGQKKRRYLVDASYCQVGCLWPPVKPYWRYALQRARELGLDQGKWPELFSERHFLEYVRLG